MQQKIIVTALPNGFGKPEKSTTSPAGLLQVSAAISLQVTDADTTLATVDDFREWPARITNAQFSVYINDKEVAAQIIPSVVVDSDLWGLLFPASVIVKTFPSPKVMADKEIISYPVKHIVDHLSRVMRETGQKFIDKLPDASHYTSNDVFAKISEYAVKDYDRKNISKSRTLQDEVIKKNVPLQVIQKALAENKFVKFAESANPEGDFTQLRLFHGFYNKIPFTTQTPKPQFEFHDILSALTTYPQLLRSLRLIVDLKLLDKNIPLEGSLRIIPKGINFTRFTQVVCPPTAYALGNKGFYARADAAVDSNISKGHVKINPKRFTVFQLDADGGALKLAQQIDALLLKKAKQNFHAQQGLLNNANEFERYYNQAKNAEGLPSQRTAGIAIASNGLAERLHKTFVRMTSVVNELGSQSVKTISNLPSFNGSYLLSSKLLFADDVNLGYRMDILDVEKSVTNWFSLHHRNNQYSFPVITGKKWNFGQDEGFLQLAGSTDKRYSDTHIKIGETIARWEGWSLSVPKPGRSLNDRLANDGDKEFSEAPKTYAEEKAKFENAGKMDFKLQVLSEIVPGTLPKLRFGKTYAIRLRTVDIAGNGVAVDAQPEEAEAISQKIVYKRFEPTGAPFLIMGNQVKDGESSEQIVIRSNENLTLEEYATSAKVTFEPTIRHVKPPRATVQIFEQHGLLDSAIGSKDAGKVQEMYQRLATKDPKFEKADDDPSLSQLQVVKDKDAVIEYLADPMAVGVSFFLSANDPNENRLLPPGQVFRITFFAGEQVEKKDISKIPFDPWNPRTFRVKLVDVQPTKEVLQWIAAERTLLVAVPKGFIFKLNYSCFWKPEDINTRAGVLDLLQLNNLPAKDAATILDKIQKGQHWMFSPWREMTFVHAVQQPLQPAKINTLDPERAFNDSNAFLRTTISVPHSQSTDKVDIEGEWIERVDDVSKDGPETIVVKSKVHQFDVTYGRETYNFVVNNNEQKPPLFPKIKHQFEDTRHRWVTYKTIATTRYREYFTTQINLLEKNNGRAGATDQFLPLTKEFVLSQKVNILSSSRPVAPHLAYVIPSFQWERFSKFNLSTRTRVCALRVYLHRPWYSSGEGEQLAVVLLPQGVSGDKEKLLQTFTHWGTDPIRKTSNLPSVFPALPAFTNIDESDTKRQLVEMADIKTTVACYNVSYDAERHLYYTDIIIDTGTVATPFIKLALARYQKHSVKDDKNGTDCCLSPVVLTDYIQVLPIRKTSLQLTGGNNNFTLGVSGVALENTRIVVRVDEAGIAAAENSYINLIPFGPEKHIKEDDSPVQPAAGSATFNYSKQFNLPDIYKTRPFMITIFEYEMVKQDPLRATKNAEGKIAPVRKLLFSDVYEVNTGR